MEQFGSDVIKNYPDGCRPLEYVDCDGICPFSTETENAIPVHVKEAICQMMTDLAAM